MQLLVSHHATFYFFPFLRCKSQGSCQISFPASERAKLDSDRRWVLTEAASELAGNLTYADNLCKTQKYSKKSRKAIYIYNINYISLSSDCQKTQVWQQWQLHFGLKPTQADGAFSATDSISEISLFFSLFLVISGTSSVCIESTARCIQCILIAHNMLHKDQQLFSMAQHRVIPQWYHEGFKIQG